jgi:hypothetical protein
MKTTIGATSAPPTTTIRLAILDNIEPHQRQASPTAGELAGTKPSPPVARVLVEDDDEPRPFISNLILHLTLVHIASGFKGG